MADLTDHHGLVEPVLLVAEQDADGTGLPVRKRNAEVEDIGDEPRIRERGGGQGRGVRHERS